MELSIGSPLFFFVPTPEGELVGEWEKARIVGEFDGHWLVAHDTKIYSVDQHTMSSERTMFYTKPQVECEPRGYWAIYESLKQFLISNRHNKMPYPDLRAMYDIADKHARKQHG